MRQARGRKFRNGQARRKLFQAVVARDLFDQIYFARNVGAPGRLAALPHRVPGFRPAGVLPVRLKAEQRQDGFDFGIRNVAAHYPQEFSPRKRQMNRRAAAGINIHHTGERLRRRRPAGSVRRSGARPTPPTPDRSRVRTVSKLPFATQVFSRCAERRSRQTTRTRAADCGWRS